MKYPLKLIEWEDAFSDTLSKWLDLADYEPATPLIVLSVGFEIARTESLVTLCQSMNDEGRGGGLIMIPLSTIRREKTLSKRLRT